MHVPSQYCMELSEDHKEVYMDKCNGSPSQKWEWSRHLTPQRAVSDWY